MYDGTKLKDVSVEVDALMTNDRLTFGALVDGQTGVILNPVRTAYDRGLIFRLVPRAVGQGYRVEVKGSLHKFFNNGQHNANPFTVNDLLLTLDELVRLYGFNLFQSAINNIEFGVNVELPFAVSQVLKNLICYKNQPFYLDTKSDVPYYVCLLQRYAVKIYDKGKQKGLDSNLLRFEIRVRKMEYFNGTGISTRTLSDLLNVANYKPLGELLVDTFNEILFDDPAINTADLKPDEQEVYRNGRNPRYWQLPNNLTLKQANAHRQRLSRTRRRFRALLDKHGDKWQQEVSALICQTWARLTAVNDDLLKRIDEYQAAWKNLTKLNISPELPEPIDKTFIPLPAGGTCHKLTDYNLPVRAATTVAICHELTAIPTPDLSRINPLYSGVDCDTNSPDKSTIELNCQPLKPEVVVCPITGIVIENPRPRQRFVSTSLLKTLYHADRQTFDRVAAQFLTVNQAGASLDQQCYHMAHNIRNAYTNQFNNPLRRIKKYLRSKEGQMLLLFPINESQLTDRIQAGIEYRRGTRYEVDL